MSSSRVTTSLGVLILGAVGVVYGDIGTSPLYALKECFHGPHAIALTPANIMGVLSLIFWSLMLVITLKYLTFVMRADNRGEGGIFALLALVNSKSPPLRPVFAGGVILAALAGASLLYGDGVITPAISVLSAVEGLSLAVPAAAAFTVPLTCLILVALFLIQRHGTTTIGHLFGPIMVLWFLSLAVLGGVQVWQHPQVLAAMNPWYALHFFMTNHWAGFVILGSVVLCITGGEALYADMGHFGRRAIRLSWYLFVCPALLLNYFGQGALLLHRPEAASNPFFGLAPDVLLIPLVILATMAAVIASQALISGIFSLARQAIQLGFFPRLQIVHTSSATEGQIYVPLINYSLMAACVTVVLIFQESSRLAAAYGIAVTANMVLTSIVFFAVLRHSWSWSLWKSVPLVGFFLALDMAYLGANLTKFADGGWFPTVVAALVLTLFLTWRDGRRELGKRMAEATLPLYYEADGSLSLQPQAGTGRLFLPKQHLPVANLSVHFLTSELMENVVRVPGTAVFMAVSAQHLPTVLVHHLKLNHMLHEQVILLSVQFRDQPFVAAEEQLEVTKLSAGVYQVVAWYGFMQTPDVTALMAREQGFELPVIPENTTYFLGHQTLMTRQAFGQMARWRKLLFAFMSRNANPATLYFRLPSERVIEIGMQIEL